MQIHCTDRQYVVLDCHDLVEPSGVATWWNSIRDILVQSVNIKSALLAAIVCRSVALRLGQAVVVKYQYYMYHITMHAKFRGVARSNIQFLFTHIYYVFLV